MESFTADDVISFTVSNYDAGSYFPSHHISAMAMAKAMAMADNH